MRHFRGRLSNERGYIGIVALLVVVAIGFVLYATVIGPKMGKREEQTRKTAGEYGVNLNENKSLPGAAMDEGKKTACKAQLDQIRQGIMMYKTENENNPAGLADLNLSVGTHFFQCADGKEPYAYDAASGTVRCVHPGHEGL